MAEIGHGHAQHAEHVDSTSANVHTVKTRNESLSPARKDNHASARFASNLPVEVGPSQKHQDTSFSSHIQGRSAGTVRTSNESSLAKTKCVETECKLSKFSLYETANRYYIVGGDLADAQFRILKIDRSVNSGDLSIAEDDIVYSKKEVDQLLNAIGDGNRSTGGLHLKYNIWGVLGFIRFTGPYYMLVVTKRSQVAMIGGHYVYKIGETELLPLTTSSFKLKAEQHAEEARFLNILKDLDLTRSFYFSYSYDITHTLQHNLVRARQGAQGSLRGSKMEDQNAMFVWNHYLLEPVIKAPKTIYDWCVPIIHGYVDQATLCVYGRIVYVTVIARRSRFFAGARFLKRGANDLGYVANDVETEQIVSEMVTTSLHAPGPKVYANWNYTSYVQHRGSIPLFWTQDTTGVNPKPPIELNLVDPFYGAAALHFDNLFERYGAPVYVLNLIKARERTPRESKLLIEFANAIEYLNQFLPGDKKIFHKAWDMSRASKSRDQDVIATLESIAEEVVTTTGFFRNGDNNMTKPTMQNGVARTNCIDCLDRTNAAQFVIGKRALGHQLHALGVIGDPSVEYDTDAVNLFTHMYHDHGDTLAIQYGGSHLVNTMETYRKINQWTSHSRDMVESFKRYYQNSFLDSQRQEAYNLFLGNYIFAQGQPMLWDLSTDYYLHHSNPRLWSQRLRRSYIDWFTPSYLEQREMPPLDSNGEVEFRVGTHCADDYWLEYYRPLALSSFMRMFPYRMNSTLKYIPLKPAQDGVIDASPFRVRTIGDQDGFGGKKTKKTSPALETCEESCEDKESQIYPATNSEKPPILNRLLLRHVNEKPVIDDSQITAQHEKLAQTSNPNKFTPADKSLSTHWTLDQFVDNALNPSITENEAKEYQRYVNHPLNLPLVVSTDIPTSPNLEFLHYVNGMTPDSVARLHCAEEDLADYAEFLTVSDNPLTVSEADAPKKRYKAYRQWLKGKPLFKQQQRGEL